MLDINQMTNRSTHKSGDSVLRVRRGWRKAIREIQTATISEVVDL